MENKIKQTYKLQEPKPTQYKRVISTSYSSSISRQKQLIHQNIINNNNDIEHHLQSPTTNTNTNTNTNNINNNYDSTNIQQLLKQNQSLEKLNNQGKTLDLQLQMQKQKEQQIKNMNFLQGNFNSNCINSTERKSFKTQRGTLENQQSQHSGQFDLLYKPLFQNPILNQTQDYTSTTQYGAQSSIQQLLPDVSQQTILINEMLIQKNNQIQSQGGQRSKFRNHVRDISLQQKQRSDYENKIIGAIQINSSVKNTDQNQTLGQDQPFDKQIHKSESRDLKQYKLNMLNRSFMLPSKQNKRASQRVSNDFQSVDISIDRKSYGLANNLINAQNQQNQSQSTNSQQLNVSLLRNQRLKLLDTIKRKSKIQEGNNLQQSTNYSVNQNLTKQSQLFDKSINQFDLDKSQDTQDKSITKNVQLQYQPQSQPQTFRAGNNESQVVIETESHYQSHKKNSHDISHYESQIESQQPSRHIIIKQKFMKSQEIGTQTGNGEYLQSLANSKHQNLKKIIDNLSKELDMQEINIEAKQRMKNQNYDKIYVCKDKNHIYLQSLSKLFGILFEDQQSYGQKMTQIIKKQFKRCTQGMDQTFTQLFNTHMELNSRQVGQFELFKSSLQKLSDQLKDTHTELIKVREHNYEEYLKLDKQHPTRKAFELLGSLNTLLQDQNQKLQQQQSQLVSLSEQSIDHNNNLDFKSLGDNFHSEAINILIEFDQIDKLPDAFDRKMRKTQLLMQLQATDVTRTLREVHQILLLKNNSVLNKSTKPFYNENEQAKEEQRQIQLLHSIENEISERFSSVQKLTALKVLNRYYKPKQFKEIEIQTDENKIYEKYYQKKLLIRELRTQKETEEKKSIDLGKQLRYSVEEGLKLQTSLKLQEVTMKDQEEKLTDLIKKELQFKFKNDDLTRRYNDLDQQHNKMKQEREYLQQKIQKKIEKLQKLQLEMNEMTVQKTENERKLKQQIEQLQESYKVMSEAYVKERSIRESFLQGSKLEGSQGQDGRDSQFEEISQNGGNRDFNYSQTNTDGKMRDSYYSKSESPKKSTFNNANGKGGNNSNTRNGQGIPRGKQYNNTGSNENDSILEDERENYTSINNKGYQNDKRNGSKNKKGGNTQNNITYKKGSNSKNKNNNSSFEKDSQNNNSQSDQQYNDDSYDTSQIHLRSINKNEDNLNTDSLTNTNNAKSVKFHHDSLGGGGGLYGKHRSIMHQDNSTGQDMFLDGQDPYDKHNMTSKNNRKNGMDKYGEFKFADYMRPTKQKSSSKNVTQFDEMSFHLIHNERCGPNCTHLNRSNMRSPNKNNRQLLPLKKQKLELDD